MSRFVAALVILVALPWSARADRLKDLARISSVRANQLVGFGLVVGLKGTGDTERVSFTLQPVLSMLKRMGILVDPSQIRLRNVAAVIVTAELPPFARNGDRVDVTVASMGDAKSLAGGVLVQTPLKGADGAVYAVAQGNLSVGGFSAGGRSGTSVRKNHDTVGRIPNGALVERELGLKLDGAEITYSLRRADFTTAARVAQAISGKVGEGAAKAVDPATVVVKVPDEFKEDVVGFVASLEALEVQPDEIARVVVNERTGTVIMGQEVRIGTVAIAHGGLTIRIQESQEVSQPAPLGKGDTVAADRTKVQVKEARGSLKLVERGTSLADVVAGLNALGVTPRDLVAILQAIAASGAMNAELVVQ